MFKVIAASFDVELSDRVATALDGLASVLRSDPDPHTLREAVERTRPDLLLMDTGDGGSGAVVCRSGICAATGVNAGLCEACSVDGDCPTGQVCSTSNTCVTPGVDAGADASVDSGTEADSGASDSGSGDSSTAADAEPSGDATAEAGPDANVEAGVDASDSGAVEGGGCSTAGAFRERGGMPGVLLGGSSIFAVLAARRRRPRGQAQSRRVS